METQLRVTQEAYGREVILILKTQPGLTAIITGKMCLSDFLNFPGLLFDEMYI